MAFGAGARKLALTVHVIASVGWIGAVASFFALSLVGIESSDAALVRGIYRAMQLTTWYTILPLAVISLKSGLVSSLGTNWGLFRHYWILVKLLITFFATSVLLIHMQPIDVLGVAASQTAAPLTGLGEQQWMMVVASALALITLCVLTALSVYKPPGLTRYGGRVLRPGRGPTPANTGVTHAAT